MQKKSKPVDTTLAPFIPYKTPTEIPGQFATNMNWLQTNRKEYKNKWVALDNGILVISGDTYEDIKPFIIDHPNVVNVMRFHVGHDISWNEEEDK